MHTHTLWVEYVYRVCDFFLYYLSLWSLIRSSKWDMHIFMSPKCFTSSYTIYIYKKIYANVYIQFCIFDILIQWIHSSGTLKLRLIKAIVVINENKTENTRTIIIMHRYTRCFNHVLSIWPSNYPRSTLHGGFEYFRYS